MTQLNRFKEQSGISDAEINDADAIITDVYKRFDNEKNSEDGKMHLLADLRRAFIALERVEKNHEWDTLETEIREEFDRLERANNDLGNKHDEAIDSLRKQADEAITRKDVQYGRIVLKRIHEQFLQ